MLHPALPDCPGHEFWARDFKGATGLFSFVLDGGDDAARTRLIEGLELFGIGYSWGGLKAWRSPPIRCAPRPRLDLEGPLVRLHIGLEDPDDLIADLEAGLAALRRERMRGLAGALGLPIPDSPDYPAAGAALGIVAGLVLVAWLAGRFVGPVLAGFWERTAGRARRGAAEAGLLDGPLCRHRARRGGRAQRLCLAAARALDARPGRRRRPRPCWPGASRAASASRAGSPGCSPRSLFAALLADAVGGLAPLGAALERTGFSLGSRRITLLALVQIVDRPARCSMRWCGSPSG